MRIQIYTRTIMCSSSETTPLVEASLSPIVGIGPGGPQSWLKIEEADGATVAAYVFLTKRNGALANTLKFVEYDPRAHRLITLASFSFWVSSMNSFQTLE